MGIYLCVFIGIRVYGQWMTPPSLEFHPSFTYATHRQRTWARTPAVLANTIDSDLQNSPGHSLNDTCVKGRVHSQTNHRKGI